MGLVGVLCKGTPAHTCKNVSKPSPPRVACGIPGKILSCLWRTRLIELSCRLATNRPPELPLGIPGGRFPVLNKNRFSVVPQTLMFTTFSFPQGSPIMPTRNDRKHCKCDNHSLTFSKFTPHIHVVSCTSLLTPRLRV